MLLLAMLWMVSCSNYATPGISSDDEITFGLANTDGWNDIQESRAVIVDKAELANQGFGVFAYYAEQTPDFMNNTRVYSTDKGETWTYSPVKYWPNNKNDKLSFFAYAPYNKNTTINGSKINFTVNAKVENQVDLLWSSTNTKNLNKANGTITFGFRHALSRIGFSAQAIIENSSHIDDMEKVVMKVKKIVLTSTNDETGVGMNVFHKKAVLNLDNPTINPVWSNWSGTQSYTLDDTNLQSEGLTLTKNRADVTQNPLNKNNSYLMIIPQDLSKEGFRVYMEYDVELWYSKNYTDYEYHTYTNKCVGDLKIKFEPGKAYTLKFLLGLENATLGEVSMADWDEVNLDRFDKLLGE